MSRRRKLVLWLLGVVVLLFGAASLWQTSETDPRYARVLLLDPRTGETLHEQVMDGGYAVVALLSGGRVAVATLDSCPGGKGGHVTVLEPSLQRVIHRRTIEPCIVARIDPAGLRSRLGEDMPGLGPHYDGNRVIVYLGKATLVETSTQQADGSSWLTGIAAFDGSGHLRWKRSDLGRLGVADARDGRVVVPVFGTFTPGSD